MNGKRVKNETPDEDGLSVTPSQEFISIDVDENSMSSIDLGINAEFWCKRSREICKDNKDFFQKYCKIVWNFEKMKIRRRQLNFLLYGQPGELIRVGRSAK